MEVIKRSGEVVEFDPDKIYQAVLKAAQTVYVLTDDLRQNLAQVTKKVVMDLEEAKVERATISMIQSMVEHRLLGAGYITIAEHYISYRLQRDLERSDEESYGDRTRNPYRRAFAFEQIQVTKKVAMDLDEAQVERATISMIQSLVEQRLLGAGYITIAEHYISYRLQRDLERSGYGDHIAVHLHFEQIR